MNRTAGWVIAMASGLLMLITSVIPGTLSETISSTMLQWVILIAAAAGLVAIANLMIWHWKKLTIHGTGDIKSGLVLLGFVATFALGVFLKPDHPVIQRLIFNVQFPIEATLMGILCVVLIVAAVKLFQNKPGWMSLVFILSAVVFLIAGSGWLSMDPSSEFWKEALAAINTLPLAGARGILLGVAIGGIVTGVRVIFGLDRSVEG